MLKLKIFKFLLFSVMLLALLFAKANTTKTKTNKQTFKPKIELLPNKIKFNQFVYYRFKDGVKVGFLKFVFGDDNKKLRIDGNLDDNYYFLTDFMSTKIVQVNLASNNLTENFERDKYLKHFAKKRILIVPSKALSKVTVNNKTVQEFNIYYGSKLCLIIGTTKDFSQYNRLLSIFNLNAKQTMFEDLFAKQKKLLNNNCLQKIYTSIPKILTTIGFPIYWHNAYNFSTHLIEIQQNLEQNYFDLPLLNN